MVWLAWWASAAIASLSAGQTTNAPAVLRIGVSQASFGSVNRNDGLAALKAWGVSLTKERRLQIDVQVDLVEQENELGDAVAQRRVDAVSMTAEGFIRSGLQPDQMYLTSKHDRCTEQYVVLVRRDSGIDDLNGLRGRKLVRHASPMTSPAVPWLETLLAPQAPSGIGRFLGELSTLDNPSKAVLRVFFRQSDAALVSTNAFALAGELNPQLTREVKVLACSPPLVPSLFFFSPEFTAPERAELEAAILELHRTPVGQQVLTVFQGSRMERRPISFLESTRALYEEFEHLKAARKVAAASASAPDTAAPAKP